MSRVLLRSQKTAQLVINVIANSTVSTQADFDSLAGAKGRSFVF